MEPSHCDPCLRFDLGPPSLSVGPLQQHWFMHIPLSLSLHPHCFAPRVVLDQFSSSSLFLLSFVAIPSKPNQHLSHPPSAPDTHIALPMAPSSLLRSSFRGNTHSPLPMLTPLSLSTHRANDASEPMELGLPWNIHPIHLCRPSGFPLRTIHSRFEPRERESRNQSAPPRNERQSFFQKQ